MEEKELSQNREVQKGNSGRSDPRERMISPIKNRKKAEKAEEKKKASEQAVT